MRIGIFVIIIIGCYSQTLANCPSNAEVLLPCRCQHNIIYCGGNSYYNLRNIFVSLSGALKEEDKHFNVFQFNNTAMNELVSNVFYDITFETIIIDSAYNLTKININAFASINCYVKQFYLSNTPYGNDSTAENNIFNLINNMTNIVEIDIWNTSLTAIPSNALIGLNKLKTLFFYYNPKLTSIDNYSFYDLNNLTLLLLRGNPIDTFPEHFLSFRNRNTNTLEIDLSEMPHINSDSFSIGMFTTINRPFILKLQYEPQLKSLPENIFNAVLSNGNQIDLTGTRLECDCKTYWLYKNKAVDQSLLINALCTDGKSVFTEREKYLDCNA